MSLYAKEDFIPTSSLPVQDFTDKEDSTLSDEMDTDFVSLENHVRAYESLTNITTGVSFEGFNFLDRNNHVLFNEYLGMVKRNLNVNLDGAMALESAIATPHGLKHYQLSLEGIIGNMWAAIKKVFIRLGSAIKEFFKRHFTRLGKNKKRLENLLNTLKKTDKDILEINLEKVPNKIKSAFPYKGDISERDIKESVAAAAAIEDTLQIINNGAVEMAKKSVMDRDFVSRIKALADTIKDARGNTKEEGLRDKAGRVVPFMSKTEKSKDNDKFKDIANKATDEKAGIEKELSQNAGQEDIDADTGIQKVVDELTVYFGKIAKSMEGVRGRKLPGGKVLKTIKIEPDSGIELEFDDDKDTPDSVSLGSKSSLTNLVSDCLGVIEAMEKTAKVYGTVNDTIMNGIKTVDSLIGDLDRLNYSPDAARYKKKLENQVKLRLKLMQTFFTNYNKINKNFMSMVLDVSEGVVVYATESLKKFGDSGSSVHKTEKEKTIAGSIGEAAGKAAGGTAKALASGATKAAGKVAKTTIDGATGAGRGLFGGKKK